jgi:hypothetical protein
VSLPLAHSNKVCLDILLTLSSSLAIETMMTMENKFESYMGEDNQTHDICTFTLE